MKPVLLFLLLLGAALAGAGASANPTATKDIDVEPEPADDFQVWARAHATVCTNAIDGSISSISHSVCGDGWGPTWEVAEYWATLSLANFTCLGPQWGCCQYVVDQDFNTCGK